MVAPARKIEYRARIMDAVSEPLLPSLATAHLDIGSDVGRSKQYALAWADIAQGAALWRLGATLGWLDIKLKYRGSLLGPFWLTISTGVWIGAMGGLYSVLFHQDMHVYLPFLALSLVTWNAIGGLVGDACTTFTQSEGTIRSLRMPFFVHAIRVVVRTFISFLHNVPVIFAVFAFYSMWPGFVAFQSLIGLGLWLIDAFAACILLGAVCARFRDIPPIVGSVMQIAFFITPIVWRPEQLGANGWWLPYNPFDAILEVVRAPLLGAPASGMVWALALTYSALFCGLTALAFSRVRTRIAYWM
jgi:lipopolysaccharide transport system permease protein